jgi:hypothetical protein
VGVGVAAFAGYALACAPAPYLLDSAELAQAAFGLGIAHPPGEPVAALWGKLFCLLPAGSVAWRVGLGQAAAGAVAAVLLFRITLHLLALLDHEGGLGAGTRLALGAAAALGFAFAPGVVGVADRPEVYALQTALSLGALLAALHARAIADPRPLLLAALLIGLGVANHPLVAGLSGVGATLLALPVLRGRPLRLLSLSVLALLLGAAVLVYLPMRAQALFAQAAVRGADTINWGDARTPGGLGWVLSARTFASKSTIVHAAAAPGDLPFVLMDELEVVFTVLAPLGMLALLWSRRTRLVASAVVATWAGSIAAALYGGFDPANPDVRGYLGPAIALTALFSVAAVAAGLAPLVRWKRPWLTPALAGLLCAATLTRFPSGAVYPGLRHAAAADLVTGALLDGLPPRAALLTAHFESAFLVGYQRLVEGRRPDVSWAHLGFLAHPGARARLAAAQPEVASLFTAPLSRAALEAVNPRHPLRLEPDEHLDRSIRHVLLPDGFTWRIGAPHSVPEVPTRPPARALAEAGPDRQVRGFLAWRAYSDAVLACENRLEPAARASVGLLLELLPRDQRAQRLAANCPVMSRKPPILRGGP